MEQYTLVFWLVFLLAAVAVTFFVLPTLAPPVLVGVGVVLLVVAAYKHWSTFGTVEYERATWQYNLRQYGSYVMMGAVLLGAYGFYTMNQASGSGGAVADLMGTATNTSSSPMLPIMSGGGFGTVMKTASSRITELMRRGRITTNH
jgi:hypothetical protein